MEQPTAEPDGRIVGREAELAALDEFVRSAGSPRALVLTGGPGIGKTTLWEAEEFVAVFRRWYGPTVKAFAALEGSARDALERDLVDLARRYDRLGPGATAIPATYTEAVAITR